MDTHHCWRAPLQSLSVLAVLLALTLVFGGARVAGAQDSGGGQSPGAPAAVPKAQEDDDRASSSGNVPMRWLPNQKILRGAPPTRISLESIIERFVSEGAFADPAEVTIEVDPSSSLVPGAVDPIIQDHDFSGTVTLSARPTLSFAFPPPTVLPPFYSSPPSRGRLIGGLSWPLSSAVSDCLYSAYAICPMVFSSSPGRRCAE